MSEEMARVPRSISRVSPPVCRARWKRNDKRCKCSKVSSAIRRTARCVTLAFGAFDWHENNFVGLRQQAPLLDQGLSALVEDLRERGLDRDVTVVAWGEFGRSPRINGTAGRDHWPLVSCALLAGGGMRVGQVIGSTNRNGETAKDRPVHFREVIATVYHNLGIDVQHTTLDDFAGRPQYLTDHSRPIPELV